MNKTLYLKASGLVCLGLAILTSSDSSSTASQETTSILLSDDLLYESTNGSLTSMRVIEVDPTEYPRTESSFIENAVMANVGQVQNIGTYEETIISPNITRGIGKGLLSSATSGDMIAWTAYDQGERQSDGSYIFRGLVFFHSLTRIYPNDGGSYEFAFLDNKVGSYRTVANETASSREIWLLQGE